MSGTRARNERQATQQSQTAADLLEAKDLRAKTRVKLEAADMAAAVYAESLTAIFTALTPWPEAMAAAAATQAPFVARLDEALAHE